MDIMWFSIHDFLIIVIEQLSEKKQTLQVILWFLKRQLFCMLLDRVLVIKHVFCLLTEELCFAGKDLTKKRKKYCKRNDTKTYSSV